LSIAFLIRSTISEKYLAARGIDSDTSGLINPPPSLTPATRLEDQGATSSERYFRRADPSKSIKALLDNRRGGAVIREFSGSKERRDAAVFLQGDLWPLDEHLNGWQKTVGTPPQTQNIMIGTTSQFYPLGNQEQSWWLEGMSGCTAIFIAVC
jgi:hypothetical protein